MSKTYKATSPIYLNKSKRVINLEVPSEVIKFNKIGAKVIDKIDVTKCSVPVAQLILQLDKNPNAIINGLFTIDKSILDNVYILQ